MLLGLFALSSCVPEFNFDNEDLDDEWKPGYAIPLLDVDLSLEDALSRINTNGFVEVDEDNLVIAVYQSSRFSISGNQFIVIPDFVLPIISNPMTVPSTFQSPIELNNILLKDGRVFFSASSLETAAVNVTFTIPDLSLNGAPYTRSYTIPASDGSTPEEISDTVSIPEYELSFTGGDFEVAYTATLTNGQAATINAAFGLIDLEQSYIDGYFGNTVLNLPTGETVLDLFANWNQGNVIFEDPKFIFRFYNSYGFPIRFTVDSVSATTNFAGVVELQSSVIDNGIDLNFPAANQAGTSSVTTVTLDANNSNVEDLISNVPYGFYYGLYGESNPDNNTLVNNFLTDTSRVEAEVSIELPMYGSAGQFSLQDTFDFDVSEYSDVDRMSFKVNTENGFPFEVGMQVYFLTSDNQLVDSLFSEITPVLAPAPVDGDGNVTSIQTASHEAAFDETRFATLKDEARRIVLVGYIQTTDGGTVPVKIYSNYNLKLQLGAIIGI